MSHAEPAAVPGTPSLRPAVAWICVAVALLYFTTAGGSLTTSDAVVVFDLTRSLVQEGSVAVPARGGADIGVDGRAYSQWGIGHSLYGIPFYLAGAALQGLPRLESLPGEMLPKAAFALGNVLPAALSVGLCFLLSLWVSGRVGAAAFATLGLGAGSLLWPYSGIGFNAALTAGLISAAAVAAWAEVRRGLPAGLPACGWLLGLAWATRHEMVLLALPFAAWLAVEAGDRRRLLGWLRRLLPGLLVVGCCLAAYNWYRFGSVTDVGHSPPLDGSGWYGLFLSPGGSVFLYVPLLLAWPPALARLASRDRSAAFLLAAVPLTPVLLYASMANWYGGRSYGPRFLVPLLPLLFVPLACLWGRDKRARRLLAGLLLASVAVQLPPVLVDYGRVSEAYASRQDARSVGERLQHLDSSPQALVTAAAVDRVPANLSYLLGLRAPPPVAGDAYMGTRASLDVWWVYLLHLGVVPWPVALAAGLLCVGLTAAAGRRAWTRVRALQEGVGG